MNIKHIYLAKKPADLRKGIDGYVSLVQGMLELDPLEGSLFLFVNRGRNKMKGIVHDANGYWLIYKRIERSHLEWPVSDDPEDFIMVSQDQLQALLSGMTIIPKDSFLPRTYAYV